MINHPVQLAIYSLKHQYGEPVTFIRRVTSGLNVQTGKKTVTYDSHRIEKVVLLPHTADRKFEYDLSYILAAREFSLGAESNIREVRIIVDKKDIDFELTHDHWAIFQERRWDVNKIEDFQLGTGFIVTLRQLEGGERKLVAESNGYNCLDLSHTATAVIA